MHIEIIKNQMFAFSSKGHKAFSYEKLLIIALPIFHKYEAKVYVSPIPSMPLLVEQIMRRHYRNMSEFGGALKFKLIGLRSELARGFLYLLYPNYKENSLNVFICLIKYFCYISDLCTSKLSLPKYYV